MYTQKLKYILLKLALVYKILVDGVFGIILFSIISKSSAAVGFFPSATQIAQPNLK